MSTPDILNYTPPENVPEAVTALANRYRNLHSEQAVEFLFLVDRHHRFHEEEPLTGAEYTKSLPRLARDGKQGTVRSKGIETVFEDYLERGEHDVKRNLERNTEMSLADKKKGRLLVEPPEDAPTDEYVNSYVNQALEEFAEATGENPFDSYGVLSQEPDFINTVLTRPVTP